jgi:hypothetical protein
VLSKPLRPSLMFAGKAGAYPIEASFNYSTLGYAPALTANNRLGCKGMTEINTLAYSENS